MLIARPHLPPPPPPEPDDVPRNNNLGANRCKIALALIKSPVGAKCHRSRLIVGTKQPPVELFTFETRCLQGDKL